MRTTSEVVAAIVALGLWAAGCGPLDVADPFTRPVAADVLDAYPVGPSAERPTPVAERPPILRPAPVLPVAPPGPVEPPGPTVTEGPGIERPSENPLPNVGGVQVEPPGTGVETDVSLRELVELWEDRDDLSDVETRLLAEMKVLIRGLKPGEVPRLEADVSTLRKDDLYFLVLRAWNAAGAGDAQAAADVLEEAARLAASHAPLRIVGAEFATKITSYGVYEPVDKAEFAPGARVLVYFELENFVREPTPEGEFRTVLERRIHIMDGAGRLVAEIEFPAHDYRSGRYTHDFYWPTQFVLPRQVVPGEYVLKVIARDAVRGQTAEARIEFEVVTPGA
jgi:hypothetical protein